jgi:hypothetical protein
MVRIRIKKRVRKTKEKFRFTRKEIIQDARSKIGKGLFNCRKK